MDETTTVPAHLLSLRTALTSRIAATETAVRLEQQRARELDDARAAHDAAAENLQRMADREQEITTRYCDALRAAGYVETADGPVPGADPVVELRLGGRAPGLYADGERMP